MFADPDFDGDPVKLTEEELLKSGETRVLTEEPRKDVAEPEVSHIIEPPEEDRRKYYFDGGSVEIAAHLVHELDPDGKQLRVVRYTDYAAEKVRTLCPTASELHKKWSDPTQRFEIIQALEEKGVSFAELAEQAKMPEADPFDLLCHLAFNAPLRTRRERAQRLKSERKGFFEQYGPEARQIWRSFWKNTRSTAMPNSSCRTCYTSRPSQRTARCAKSARLSVAPRNSGKPCTICKTCCTPHLKDKVNNAPIQESTQGGSTANYHPIPWEPHQVRARYHAQRQGTQR